jgi:cytochrome bd-type quinol oxidase subunit 1
MRTAEAVTNMPMMAPRLVAFTMLYIVLAVVVVMLLRFQVFKSPEHYVAEAEEGRAPNQEA